jgi:hypothetical protein
LLLCCSLLPSPHPHLVTQLPAPCTQEIKAAQRKAAAARIKTLPVGKIPVCLFLHGAGVNGPYPPKLVHHYGDVRGSLRTYWGPFNDWFADLCDTFEYSWAHTDERGYQNEEMSSFYAKLARSAVNRGGVVFAHSMANAMLAWACHHNKEHSCVPWYNLGGGFSGQEIGDLIGKSLRKTLGDLGIQLSEKILDNFSVKNGPSRLSSSGEANAMAKTVQDKRLLKVHFRLEAPFTIVFFASSMFLNSLIALALLEYCPRDVPSLVKLTFPPPLLRPYLFSFPSSSLPRSPSLARSRRVRCAASHRPATRSTRPPTTSALPRACLSLACARAKRSTAPCWPPVSASLAACSAI